MNLEEFIKLVRSSPEGRASLLRVERAADYAWDKYGRDCSIEQYCAGVNEYHEKYPEDKE